MMETMAKTSPLKMAWTACAAIAMLSTTACSAQQAPDAPKPAQRAERPAVATAQAAADSALQPGEYITEQGWARLLLKQQNRALTFSLESTTGEDMCALDGTVVGDQGVANSDNGPSSCRVKFARTSQGIDVAAATPAECKAFCGDNGDFAAPYLQVKEGCGRDDVDRTRSAFQWLYDGKDYKAALTTLSPVLARCVPTLEWEEEGAIRNDLAITQYKNGLYAQCLATLDKYAEDAGKDDDAAVEGWTPTLADRQLAIVRAARTNIGLCRKALAKK